MQPLTSENKWRKSVRGGGGSVTGLLTSPVKDHETEACFHGIQKGTAFIIKTHIKKKDTTED